MPGMKLFAATLLCLLAGTGVAEAQIAVPGQSGAPPLSYQAPVLRYQPPKLKYAPPEVRQPATARECSAANAKDRRRVRRCVADAPEDPSG